MAMSSFWNGGHSACYPSAMHRSSIPNARCPPMLCQGVLPRYTCYNLLKERLIEFKSNENCCFKGDMSSVIHPRVQRVVV